MRVAIATEGNFVSAHFGRCPVFTLIDIENGKVLNRDELSNPGHQPGLIPQFLKEKGVECIIAGGMGMRAISLFEQEGIRTMMGISGKVNEVIEQLLKGELKGGASLCKPGSGKGYGLDKKECDHPHDKHI
jgi:predicted Fe-Mo cluster-binding NifX family protein